MTASHNECPIWEPGQVHLLIDPDKWEIDELRAVLSATPKIVGTIIVGGTYTHTDRFAPTMAVCKETGLIVGNILSAGPLDSIISHVADYLLIPILFASGSTKFVLDHLILSAPVIHRYGLTTTSFAYLLLDGGSLTSTAYFTQTVPIPRGKPEILRSLGLAARYMGLDGIYLEAGSGAMRAVTPEEVNAAADLSGLPVLVGGGVHSAAACRELFDAGASGVIVGTAVEQRRHLGWLEEM